MTDQPRNPEIEALVEKVIAGPMHWVDGLDSDLRAILRDFAESVQGQATPAEEIECPECEGSGTRGRITLGAEVLVDDPCTRCSGTGSITLDQFARMQWEACADWVGEDPECHYGEGWGVRWCGWIASEAKRRFPEGGE